MTDDYYFEDENESEEEKLEFHEEMKRRIKSLTERMNIELEEGDINEIRDSYNKYTSKKK